MTIEMSKVLFRPSQKALEGNKWSVNGKNMGFNEWKPKKKEGTYKYILTNKSRVQSYSVGIDGEQKTTLLPNQNVEFDGVDDLKFDYWTGKLILQGEIELRVESKIKKVKKQAPVKDFGYETNGALLCSKCGRKISSRNKNGICYICRKK